MITLRQFYSTRLERWLAEREDDLAVRPPLIENGEFEQASSTYDLGIAIGQVRLLPIWMCGPVPRCLVYAAVLDSLPDDRWRVALFSPYGEPANQNEFRTSFAPNNDPPNLALRTLGLWNSFSVPGDLLGKSWNIDELPPDDLNAIALISGKPISELPRDLQLRLGPPPEIAAAAVEELNGYMAEEEAISATILSHVKKSTKPAKNIVVPILWRDVVVHEAAPMESSMVAYASDRFAVWVTDVSASVFSKKATDPTFPTPLTLHKEASDFWKIKAPEILHDDKNRVSLIWKTETQVDFGQGEDFSKMSFMSYAPQQNPIRSQPDIPRADALLYDGTTSKLLGKGSVSPNGLQITLKSKKPPEGPVQIVLCKGWP